MMLAAKLYGPNDVRVVECPIPAIHPDEILLKTGAAAICGTDLRMAANGYKGVDQEHPLTLGHEISGTIQEVGGAVRGYLPGMRVAIAPNIGCGICDACTAGETHLCADYKAFGINMDGGFAEYIRIPREAIAQGNIMVLEDAVALDVAAVFEPMACVMNGQQRTGIRLNDTVLVIGAGPIGIMHALLAKATGAANILVRDLSPARMEQCVQILPGAAAIYGDDLQASIRKMTNGRGVDVCITACPSPTAQAESLHLMAMNGRILFFGGLPAGKDEVPIHSNLIHYKQLAIHGSTRASVSQYRAVAKMAACGNLDLGRLISRKFNLCDFQAALDYAASATGLKTIISFESK